MQNDSRAPEGGSPEGHAPKDWLAEALALIDRFIQAANFPRAAVALTLAFCFYMTGSWPAVPMATVGFTLLVGAAVKSIKSPPPPPAPPPSGVVPIDDGTLAEKRGRLMN